MLPDRPRLLMVLDADTDTLLLERELAAAWPGAASRRLPPEGDLAAALNEPWDAVLLEPGVPGRPFVQTLAAIKGCRPALGVLALAGDIGAEAAVDLVQLGAADVVLKSRPERLVPALRRCLRAAPEAEPRHDELETILDSLTQGVILSDTAGQLTHWNRAALAYHGYTSLSEAQRGLPEFADTFELRELTGEVVPPERWPLARALTGETVEGVELTLRHLHQSWERDVEYTARLARDAEGQVVAVVSVTDLTERRRAAEALRRYELVARNTRDIILMMDYDGRILEANDAAVAAYGCSRDELRALSVMDLRAPATRGAAPFQMAQARDRGLLFETVHQRRDGTPFPVEVSSQSAVIDGRLTLVSIVRDITERRRAEQARADEAERQRVFIEQARDGVVVLDRDGRVFEANQAYADLLGYSLDELLTLHVWDWDVQWSREELLGQIRALGPGGDHFETRQRRKDGSFVDVDVSTTAAFVGGRKLVFCLCRDITSRKQVEAELARRERHLATILETALDGFYVVDLDGRIVEVNDAACAITGYPRDELVGMAVNELDALESPEATRARIEAIRAEGSARFETRQRRKDGGLVDIEASVTYLDNDGGQFVCFIRDVSARRQAEAELRASRADLQRAQELARLGGWRMNLRDGALSWSEATYRLFGVPVGVPMSGERFLACVHPDDREWVEATFNDGRRTGVYDLEHRIRVGDEVRWVRERAEPEYDESGELIGWFGTVQDITERKIAEEASRALEDQLRQAQKMEAVGRLAGGVAHDFNNMLSVIQGYSEMALASLSRTHPMHRDLSEIANAARRSSDLTRQLLAFSRRQLIAPTVLDLNEQLSGMERLLQRIIGEDIRLRFELGRDLAPVLLDPSQVDQMVANLVVNARDAIPDGGRITVATANVRIDAAQTPGLAPGEWVMLRVSDTGQGIDPETLAHVFEPFFTTKPKGRGTGLGLATVYGIVQQNGGEILIDSEPGQGTRVSIYLPPYRSDAPRDAVSPETAAPAAVGGGGETVLLAEDEEQVRRLTARLLTRAGYRVLAAGTAEEALALAADAESIALLLTDLIMPGMSGEALAAQLARERPGLRTLYMSGYPADTIVERGVLQAGTQYLQKPFTAESLLRKVREVLEP